MSAETEDEIENLRNRIAGAQQIFDRQCERIRDLEYETNEAGVARDKALYWLYRFCEAVERNQLELKNDETREINEHALNVLFDNNIYVGLNEPDAAILRLMEVVALDEEGKNNADS